MIFNHYDDRIFIVTPVIDLYKHLACLSRSKSSKREKKRKVFQYAILLLYKRCLNLVVSITLQHCMYVREKKQFVHVLLLM